MCVASSRSRAVAQAAGIRLSTAVARVRSRAVAQAAGIRLPTAVALVRPRDKSCGIYGGQRDTEAGFLRVLPVPLAIITPIIVQDW
jgi:hypothetical protein